MTLSNNHCEIIIPVYNGLNNVQTCVESVLDYTDYPHRIILVDDGSDRYVKERLKEYAKNFSQIKLLENIENIGFVKSANRGIRESTGLYVVLLDSDTVVTTGWLSRMVRCAESNSKIAIVNPVTNRADNLSVPMPPSYNIFTMAKRLEEISREAYPDIVTPSGFCFMIKREVIERFGGFDEIYGMGYCEESDYSMRVTQGGLRTVVAESAFVYHKGTASFVSRLERYIKNRKIFDERWGETYLKDYKVFFQKNPLGYLREVLTESLEAIPHTRRALIKHVMTKAYRVYKNVGFKNMVERASLLRASKALQYIKSFFSLKIKTHFPQAPDVKQDFFVTREYIYKLPPPRNLSVVYLVDSVGLYGGVISVVQLANELILNGHDASIVTLNEEPEPGIFNFYARPIRYKSLKDMAEFFLKADIVVATFWITAYYWMPLILERNPGIIPFYFIQDFESWFYRDRDTRQKVLDSYKIIPNKVLKSLWLQGKLEELGYSSHRIHLGLDLGMFYPRDTPKDERKQILLMAQPFKRRRGLKEAVDVFSIIHRTNPEVEFVFFGCDDSHLRSFSIPFPFTNMGKIRDQNQVANLYSSCDIFFDSSLFQGFGRPGLESMACGTPPVLTNVGGVNEYARDRENCFLVPPANIDKAVEAITRLLKDTDMYRYLKKNGIETAKKFCHKDEALGHIKLFKEIIRERDN